MPEIKKIDIITIKCNTIDTQEADRAHKCNTNTANCQGSRCEQHYTNKIHKAYRAEKCYTNRDSNSKYDS